MSFIINGTTINRITFNNTDINTLMCDEEEVFSGSIYNIVKNATTTITEAQWLEFVDNDCIALAISRGETADFIGKNVTVGTSYYNTWKIADFNHDNSVNTVDLIHIGRLTQLTNTKIVYGTFNTYSSSTVRSEALSFYNKLSTDIKNRTVSMDVQSDGRILQDKCKILSVTEVNGGGGSDATPSEGTKYPIFTDNQSMGIVSLGWLRTPYKKDGTSTSYAYYMEYGSSGGNYPIYTQLTSATKWYMIPCVRFKHIVIPEIYNTVKNSTTAITQAQWLEFLDAGCVSVARELGETSSFVKKQITLNNAGTNSTWIIADFNHDNSGNTADLILKGTATNIKFSTTSAVYSSSDVRSYLINTYLPGFDNEIKNRLQTMNVITDTGSTNDKIKILSVHETGTNPYSSLTTIEGSSYPLFNSNDDTRKNYYPSAWTRTGVENMFSHQIYSISYYGSLDLTNYYDNTTYRVTPCIRFA